MALLHLDEHYDFVQGEIRFPANNRAALWAEIDWKTKDAEHTFSVRIEQFPGSSEAEILGTHRFRCANDCDREWQRGFIIRYYDGIHGSIYNGEISIKRVGVQVRIAGFGYLADSMYDIKRDGGCRIAFDELVTVRKDASD